MNVGDSESKRKGSKRLSIEVLTVSKVEANVGDKKGKEVKD